MEIHTIKKEGRKKFCSQPRKSPHEDSRERKIYFWICIEPECEAHPTQSAKILQRWENISPF